MTEKSDALDHWTPDERFASPHGEVRWTRAGQGPPVVLMHGTPFSSHVWREIAEALSGRHTVYLWDMPGYGRSEMREGQDVSLAAQQEVFTSLLEHWGLERPRVVAHDFGGAVALRTALLDRVAYDRLALVDAVAMRPWGSPFFRLVNRSAEVFAELPEHLHEALVRAYIAGAFHREPSATTLDSLARPWLGEVGRAAFYRQISQADERYTAEFEPLLGELECPVTVLWGEEDPWLPVERGRALAEAIPQADLRLIPGGGHLVQEDAPAPLTAALIDFLGR
ncbi:alpha/beta fold hydrolase [Nocardiopsis alba]|uniref:alpha/beta fold hydrolase n=1 Tax=Nocardiopsis alba TaxID=53437 RepID=UPI0037FF49E8